jgi:peroxisomal membrane protein 4
MTTLSFFIQINLYLLSRIMLGLGRLALLKGFIVLPDNRPPLFPWFAACVWGIVLWLFEHHQSVLQGSLQSSMTYLYHDSNVWTGIRDFLIVNK